MRIPIAVSLESRDGGVTRDPKILNGLVEVQGELARVRKRPGHSDLGLVHAGTAQLLYSWNGINAIIGETIYSGNLSTIISAPTSTDLRTVGLTYTLNPSDKHANVTLSNNNLSAASSVAYRAVRATSGKSSGKWYWEAVCAAGTDFVIGVGKSTSSLAGLVGNDADGYGFAPGDGKKWTAGAGAAYTSAFSNGTVIGFALDMDAGTLTIYNATTGVSQGVMFSGLAGTLFPMVSPNAALTVTMNFGAIPFTGTAPAGHSPIGGTGYVSGLSFYASETSPRASTPRLFFHNRVAGYTMSRSGTVSKVTFGNSMGAQTYTLISLTRSGSTATASIPESAFSVGDQVTVAGAVQTEYNGVVTVSAVTAGAPSSTVPLDITFSAGTATTVTHSGVPHGLTSGTAYTISGATEGVFNGSVTVTVTDTTHFTYPVTLTTPATGTVGIIAERLGAQVVSGGTSTVTLTAHGLATGAVVSVRTSLGAAVCNSAAITVVDANTFTVASLISTTFSDSATVVISLTASSMTCDGTTVTFNVASAHHISVTTSWTWVVFGAIQSYYNKTVSALTVATATSFTFPLGTVTVAGSPIVTIPAANPTFSYSVAGSPATPATGTITAQGTGGMVPGVAYINGYHVVMDVNGNINSSASDDPTTWSALSVTTAQAVNGVGKGIARSNSNYLLAFKEWSVEFFYDAKNATGSPFSPVEPGFITIGCATGESIAEVDGLVAFMSQVKERGRSIHAMDGLQPTKISTPDVERILNKDDLASVYAYGIKFGGHALYVLTLGTSAITLVFDFGSKIWSQWSSLALGSALTVSGFGSLGDLGTVTYTSGAFSDGDPIRISGATPSPYNGIFQALNFVASGSGGTFDVSLPGAGALGPPSGMVVTAYTESYFNLVRYCNFNGSSLLLHQTSGHIYKSDPALYQDAGVPIKTFGRSTRLDAGTLDKKKMPRLSVVGDSVDDVAMVRWSDDDSQTFSAYRAIDLSEEQPETTKCGIFRRRSIEFQHVGNNPLNLSHYELP